DRNLSETIDLVRLQLGLQAGSAPVDINQVVVTITDGSQTNTLRYIDSNDIVSDDYTKNIETIMGDNGSERFAVNDIRDEDDSFTQDNPVMNTGDLINMYIATASKKGAEYNMSIDGVKDGNLSDTELNLEPRTRVEIVLTPEAGALSQATFVTPSTYGVTDIVKLYP
ncbi:flagellin, partial [Methanosalsum natronophilum]